MVTAARQEGGGDKGGKYSAQGENEQFRHIGTAAGETQETRENEEEDEFGILKVIFMFVIPLNLAEIAGALSYR